LVDNAHGAYLKFLPESRHPIDLGATICCDSAHKTLPVLTGGAYLHISKDAPKEYTERAREMLSLFASTSPSYLIMQSLDICNRYLTEDYRAKLLGTVNRIEHCKAKICNLGYHIKGSEPLKIVIECAEAEKLSAHLREYKVECEFADERYLVLMAGTENTESDFVKLEKALECYKGCREASKLTLPIGFKAKKIMSIREAMLSASEIVPLSQALGRVCATPTVSCPPAVPIVISGEEITAEAVDLFDRYGITSISVVQDG